MPGIFPEKDSTSVGIGSRAGMHKYEQLFALWERAIEPEPELSKFITMIHDQAVTALIPSLRLSTFRSQMVAGENWALIGDASGSAHPVSGGGIHYALISASLLEGSLSSGSPEKYREKWWNMCKEELFGASLWGPIFYWPGVQKLFSKMIIKSKAARDLTIELIPGGRLLRVSKMVLELLAALFETIFDAGFPALICSPRRHSDLTSGPSAG